MNIELYIPQISFGPESSTEPSSLEQLGYELFSNQDTELFSIDVRTTKKLGLFASQEEAKDALTQAEVSIESLTGQYGYVESHIGKIVVSEKDVVNVTNPSVVRPYSTHHYESLLVKTHLARVNYEFAPDESFLMAFNEYQNNCLSIIKECSSQFREQEFKSEDAICKQRRLVIAEYNDAKIRCETDQGNRNGGLKWIKVVSLGREPSLIEQLGLPYAAWRAKNTHRRDIAWRHNNYVQEKRQHEEHLCFEHKPSLALDLESESINRTLVDAWDARELF